jgi:hypothetical protein
MYLLTSAASNEDVMSGTYGKQSVDPQSHGCPHRVKRSRELLQLAPQATGAGPCEESWRQQKLSRPGIIHADIMNLHVNGLSVQSYAHDGVLCGVRCCGRSCRREKW